MLRQLEVAVFVVSATATALVMHMQKRNNTTKSSEVTLRFLYHLFHAAPVAILRHNNGHRVARMMFQHMQQSALQIFRPIGRGYDEQNRVHTKTIRHALPTLVRWNYWLCVCCGAAADGGWLCCHARSSF